ncbi:uncharacterized protein LOC144453102 [Glandiceps talaboti]
MVSVYQKMFATVLVALVLSSLADGFTRTNTCTVDLHGVCFILSEDRLSWQEARQQCEQLKGETQLNGTLVKLEKRTLRKAIDEWAANNITAWIGLHELAVETHPYWVDGEKLGKFKPNKVYPWSEDDNNSEDNNCVLVVPNAKKEKLLWQYANCDDVNQYICAVGDIADKHAIKKLKKEKVAKEKALIAEENSVSGIIEKQSENIPGTIEGDIILPPELKSKGPTRKRAAIWYDIMKWPDAKVYYKLDPTKTFSSYEKQTISNAMTKIEDKTCLTFIERTDQTSYVNISKDGGCRSFIGRNPYGPQLLSLESGCYTIGVTMHELLHSVGFLHEQSRDDRDEFVKVNYDNIIRGRESNFVIHPSALLQEVNYDYESLLHYRANSFAIDRTIPTLDPIQPVDPAILGQRDGMSPSDIADVSTFYGCSNSFHGGWSYWTSWTECEVTCGGGIQTRNRECNSPPPSENGLPCQGDDIEKRTCMDILCPDEVSYTWIGCWRDVGESELLTTLEGTGNPYITGNYWERDDPARNCVLAAAHLMHDIAALRFGGKCFSMSTADDNLLYQDGGPSDECYTGTGTINALDVYSIEVAEQTGKDWGAWTEWSTCELTDPAVCVGGLSWGKRHRTRKCETVTICEGMEKENEDCSVDCQGSDQWTCAGSDIFIFVLESVLSWNNAKSYCEDLDTPLTSHLAIVQDDVIHSEVRNYAKTLPVPIKKAYWVGCDDITSEGDFMWVDGVAVNMETAGWSKRQPKNTSRACEETGQDCCQLKKRSKPISYMLDDECCKKKKQFICHIRDYPKCVQRTEEN